MTTQKAILTTTGENIDVFVTMNVERCPEQYRDCIFTYPGGSIGIQRVKRSKIRFHKPKKSGILKQ